MNPIKVLLLYKKTSYDHYFLAGKQRSAELKKLLSKDELKRFLDTHQFHYATLTKVQQTLRQRGIAFKRFCRGDKFNPAGYDLVVTVGGDGTFMEASHVIQDQHILGVNSDPFWSVGRFCAGTAHNFGGLLDKFIAGKPKRVLFQRMQVELGKKKYLALNDVLACHSNPAAMSRYALYFRNHREQHRSSGVWVSTAAGSTGAIRSAGGIVLPQQSKNLQYKPRELYLGRGTTSYRLKGGLIPDGQSLKIASLMREGVVYLDGSHICLPFLFGTTLHITRSKYPLKVIWK